LESDVLDSLIDIEKTPLTTILSYAVHQALYQKENFSDCIERILGEVPAHQILSANTLQQLVRIFFLLEVQGDPAISQHYRERIAEVIMNNTLGKTTQSLYTKEKTKELNIARNIFNCIRKE
jgi:bacterioferritin (cytochrome b1)